MLVMESLLAEMERWSDSLTSLIITNPDEVIVVVSALVAVLAITSLLLGRRAERVTKELARVSQENEVLREENRALREGAEQEEAALQPPIEAAQPSVVPERAEVTEIAPQTIETPSLPVEVKPQEESAIVRGMRKSRAGLLGRLASFFSGKSSLDTSMLDDLEEVLILSDVGARCAAELVESVRKVAETESGVSSTRLKEMMKEGIRGRLVSVLADHRMYHPVGSPMVVLVVGVNGVGKTTTVAKLAARYSEQGKRVMVIAADTFRAAAVQQLEEWSKRVDFTLVKGPEGAKPGAVVFDGMASAKDGGFDVVLIDTAGRLHTKSNLMQELEGVRNSIKKHIPDAPHETVLVVDGVSGQNALAQAREFNAAVQLTGIVVTKLDGTPKGGIIVAISQELKVPVLFVGVGEKKEDLVRFEPAEFVSALLDDSGADTDSLDISRTVMNQ
jgi:fused signal recognition particle receptor